MTGEIRWKEHKTTPARLLEHAAEYVCAAKAIVGWTEQFEWTTSTVGLPAAYLVASHSIEVSLKAAGTAVQKNFWYQGKESQWADAVKRASYLPSGGKPKARTRHNVHALLEFATSAAGVRVHQLSANTIADLGFFSENSGYKYPDLNMTAYPSPANLVFSKKDLLVSSIAALHELGAVSDWASPESQSVPESIKTALWPN
ncbi:MAG: hypothetical protein AAFQ62_06285 [Pseudomonadota bacterium]